MTGQTLEVNSVAATLHGCTFTSNFASEHGGAVFLEEVASVYVSSSSMSNNTAQVGTGGALAMQSLCNASLSKAVAPPFDCHVEMVNVVMENNHAGFSAGSLLLFALRITRIGLAA